MPDPSKLYRRVSGSAVPTRVIAHLSVVSLVVVVAISAMTSHRGTDGAGPTSDAGFIALISQARGAAAPVDEDITASYDLETLTKERMALVDRGNPAGVPPAVPLPTPIPVDPNATPLPAPTTTGVGSTSAAARAPTVRVAQPVPTDGALMWPVPGGSISQYYHAGHLALDIAAPYGSQIVAAKAGTVTWAGWRNNGGGYVIAIDHGGGMQTVYNHLGGIWVGVGQYVAVGQGIGAVGCTGTCTGPHVHFEVIVNGVIDNPLRYL